ncbi:MAG: SPFH/Band 7/PHB domain protein [Bacteroidia bacterium]|nr:SPFH/Band 7/PHB domain protein [Bacteroidia bacterium]MCX7651249.1 SPFH/Band 7/PHB domain protein [Bacteroidia bacterium]MDW8416197.1 SPFH domain-containing protein [Bacteroidia bacterium]
MLTYILIGLVVLLLFSSLKVLPEYQRLVVLRLGRALPQAKGPGLVVIIPVIDTPIRVDLRERIMEIPKQTCITRDNAPISIDFLIYLQIVDPLASVVNVQNVFQATEGLATTTLRAVIGDIALDDVLSKRDEINQKLRVKLDEVTHRWGVQVNAVEIKEILPPAEVQESMTKQMAAERTRRAMVTEAEGTKQAQILRAEGEKTARILEAEAQKASAILHAEAQREAQLLAAEGYALALQKISEAARHLDNNTMLIQYLETLKNVGQSPSAKWIVPVEVTGLARQVGELISNHSKT